jgi:hypothetical protein
MFDMMASHDASLVTSAWACDIAAMKAMSESRHQRVAFPQNVEKSPPLMAFTEAGGDTRYAVVSEHQIRFKSILVSLGSLVLDGLVEGAHPAIEDRFHRLAARARWGVAQLGCVRRGIPGVCGRVSQGLFIAR